MRWHCKKEGQYGHKDKWTLSPTKDKKDTKDTKDNVATYKFVNLFLHL